MKKIITFLLAAILGIAASSLWAQDTGRVMKHWASIGENDSLLFIHIPQPVNSALDDYTPTLMRDNRMFFNSDRKNPLGQQSDLAYNEHIYLSQKQDTVWTPPTKTYFFNSDDQSAVVGNTSDGSKIFLYKSYHGGDLYVTTGGGSRWSTPTLMKYPVNTEAHEQSVTEESGVMVVSSDRPGGVGGHDLYWAVQNSSGDYTDFVPIEIVNTIGDEVDVRLSKDGKKLFFSSDGLSGSKGGFDVYYTRIDSTGRWAAAVGLDAPMNSEGNDRYFFDLDSAFLMTSDRGGGLGGDDIYFGRIIPKKQRVKKMVVEATNIKQADTLIEIERASVMGKLLDSAGIKEYYAMVQVGAFYKSTLEDFRKAHPAIAGEPFVIEKQTTSKGTMQKFLIDHKFATINEAAEVQKVMWNVHKITDAFVAIYNKDGKRIAIYNTIKGEFVILEGDQKPVYF